MRRLLFLLMLLAVPASAAIVTSEVIIVDPTADLQAAVDEFPSTGGILTLGPGTFNISGLVIDKPLILRGAGAADYLRAIIAGTETSTADNDMGTTLQMDTSIVNTDVVAITSRFVTIEDLTIRGPGSAGSGAGVSIHSDSTVLWKIALRRVLIKDTAAECFKIPNCSGTDYYPVILSEVEDCWFKQNKSGNAVYVGDAHTTINFKNCSVTRFLGSGVSWYYTYGCSWVDCNIEEPFGSGTFIQLNNCVNSRIARGWFENTTTFQTAYPIVLAGTCTNTHIADCNFQYGATNVGADNPRCIYVGGGAIPGFCRGTIIENCLATIAYGTRWPDNHICIGANSTETLIIGGGVTDNHTQNIAGCTVSTSTTLTRASGSFITDGVEVGDPIYPVTAGTGRIADGTFVSAIAGGGASLTMSASGTDGAITGNVVFNPNGKAWDLSVTDASTKNPAAMLRANHWRLPNVTKAQRDSLDITRNPAGPVYTKGDMVWVTDAATDEWLQVWNGTAWVCIKPTGLTP